MLLAVIVGGSGRFFGPVIGTVIIILLPEVPAPATSSG
jgi:ABC-type branched-subunit amino acid transport system permease subunit